MLRSTCARIAAVVWLAMGSLSLTAESPPKPQPRETLHARIDALIEHAAIGPLAPACSDAEFLRRIYLDLTGGLPAVETVESFLADPHPDKRATVVDELLTSVEFTRHMAIELDVILLERRTDTNIPVQAWEEYLIDSVAASKPLDRLFGELIYGPSPVATLQPPDAKPASTASPTAGPAAPELLPATKFLVSRTVEPNAVTRDVGRLAFGMDLQCAQCHDHPLVKDYRQEHYYGLYAFWHRTGLVTNAKTKAVAVVEQVEGEASFESVFTGDGRDVALPLPPLGRALISEPVFLKQEAYAVPPTTDQPGSPKYSRRQQLAEQLAHNVHFRRNWANRLWQKMLGRGLVHPLDLHHTENPPVNPALLSLLADELARADFQVRPVLRQIALSRAYQRSSLAPDPSSVNFLDIAARRRQLSAEQAEFEQRVIAAREALQQPQTRYEQLLRQQEAVAVELPKLLTAANAAAEASTQAEAELAKAASQAQQLEATDVHLAAALNACEQVAQLSPDDKELADIVRQLRAKTERAAEPLSAARQRLQAATDKRAQTRAAQSQAVSSLQTTQQKSVPASTLEPAEAAYQQARLRYEQAIYEQQALALQIQLCDTAEQFRAARHRDPELAENLWNTLVEHWTARQQLAAVRPLSAEQLYVSMLQATGHWTSQLAAARSKLAAKPPADLQSASEDKRASLEQQHLQSVLLEQLRGTIRQFVALFGGAPGEDFQATVNQALFVGNGSIVQSLLQAGNNTLTQRLLQAPDEGSLAEILYLAVLSRPALTEERQEIIDLLTAAGDDRQAVVQEMQWALLSSAEFRFNH